MIVPSGPVIDARFVLVDVPVVLMGARPPVPLLLVPALQSLVSLLVDLDFSASFNDIWTMFRSRNVVWLEEQRKLAD